MKALTAAFLVIALLSATGCVSLYKSDNTRIEKNPGDDRWGYLGYECYDLTEQQLDSRREGLDCGVCLWSVYGEAAVEMGLQPGDTVLEINGEKVRTSAQMYRRTRAIAPGEEVKMLVLRQGREMRLAGRTRPSPVQHVNSFEVGLNMPGGFHWVDLAPVWFHPGYFRIGPKFASLFEYTGGDRAGAGPDWCYLFFYRRRARVDVDGIHRVPE